MMMMFDGDYEETNPRTSQELQQLQSKINMFGKIEIKWCLELLLVVGKQEGSKDGAKTW